MGKETRAVCKICVIFNILLSTIPSGPSEKTPMDCSTLDKTILYSLGTLISSLGPLDAFSSVFFSSLLANAWSSLFANASDRANAT